MAKRSADGKTIQILRPITVTELQTNTEMVPVTVQVVGHGVPAPRTVFREERRSRVVHVLKAVAEPYPLEKIELRTIGGDKFKLEDYTAQFTEEFGPIILVTRTTAMVKGKKSPRPRHSTSNISSSSSQTRSS